MKLIYQPFDKVQVTLLVLPKNIRHAVIHITLSKHICRVVVSSVRGPEFRIRGICRVSFINI